DQSLLGRLKSLAQEARMEVMESRLDDLHEKQKRATAVQSALKRSSEDIAPSQRAERVWNYGQGKGQGQKQGLRPGARMSDPLAGARKNPWGPSISRAGGDGGAPGLPGAVPVRRAALSSPGGTRPILASRGKDRLLWASSSPSSGLRGPRGRPQAKGTPVQPPPAAAVA
ncbi:unnamed protein product, partial [Discosporangium mesarthrocarpum]